MASESTSRNVLSEGALEDFEVILQEDSDIEGDDCEIEIIDFMGAEPDEQEMDESTYRESPTILGLYTQYGEEIFLGVSPPPSRALSTPDFKPNSSQPSTSSASPTPIAMSSPREMQPRYAFVNVKNEEKLHAIPVHGDDDDAMGETFYLADENYVFQQEAKRPELVKSGRASGSPRGLPRASPRGRAKGSPCGRARGSPRGRARGSPRGGPRRCLFSGRGAHGPGSMGHQTDEPQWKKGDRLIEVYVNDDDVPEELREMIMRLVNAREATRNRMIAKERRSATADAEAHEDEFLHADYGEDEVLFAKGAHSPRFEWLSMHNYSGKREQFLPERTGPVVASKCAYEAFRQYWDDGILSHIVTETNRYAHGIAETSVSFARGWYDTNVHEILVLFSFWMMLGIIRMPSTKSCFTKNPLLQTNIFRKMFARDRYENLCRALHFNNNNNRPTDNSDRLFSFGPVLEHLNSRFQEVYVPSQDICIDESLTLWKGNLSFRQYIKTKSARLGVKTFELCESSTGYLWSFFVYLGKDTTYDPSFPSTLLKSTSTVLKLAHPLLDKGYTLFMDNWFNSPLLARYLKSRKTDCVGTLRSNCLNVPPLIFLCHLNDGQFVARHCGDVVVMAYQDKKRTIRTISTYHGIRQDRTPPKPFRESQFKPQAILDYNRGMGGVDRKDQMLEPYLLERKRCAKWTMKVFKRLLNCSILNARIHLDASTFRPKEHLAFRLELVEQILQHHLEHVPKMTAPSSSVVVVCDTTTKNISCDKPPSGLSHERFVDVEIREKHWPKKITGVIKNGRRIRRRCIGCSGQNNAQRRTSYVCCACDVPLCLEPCFKLYHTNS